MISAVAMKQFEDTRRISQGTHSTMMHVECWLSKGRLRLQASKESSERKQSAGTTLSFSVWSFSFQGQPRLVIVQNGNNSLITPAT